MWPGADWSVAGMAPETVEAVEVPYGETSATLFRDLCDIAVVVCRCNTDLLVAVV